jgi:hypothetical protein
MSRVSILGLIGFKKRRFDQVMLKILKLKIREKMGIIKSHAVIAIQLFVEWLPGL